MPSFSRSILSIALVVVASQFHASAAFSPVSVPGQVNVRASPSPSSSATAIQVVTEEMKTSYGEMSRSYRRTVYSHDDWVKHR